MNFNSEMLERIFKKTDGDCHLCHGKLSFSNYAKPDSRGAWEVDHSIPKRNGGSDHLNNLYPSHITCNRKKSSSNSKTIRYRNGHFRSPYSRVEKEDQQTKNVLWFSTSLFEICFIYKMSRN